MFIAPDPQRREWSPPDPNWTEGLIGTLGTLERLMSLSINRCESDYVLHSLVRHAQDHKFLPLLQKISFGPWHQLSCLGLGRPITSYGLIFTLLAQQGYERLETLLVNLKQSNEAIRDLKMTFNLPSHGEILPMECRRNVLNLIGEHLGGLRVLHIRFQCKNKAVDASLVSPLVLPTF
jgi:hypothetical protein